MITAACWLRAPVPAALMLLREQSSVGGVEVVLGGMSTWLFAILTKWFSLTRLETRTKESNLYASIWVENPDAQ